MNRLVLMDSVVILIRLEKDDGKLRILLLLQVNVFNVVMVVSQAGIVFKLILDISRLFRYGRLEIPLPVSDDMIIFGL